ncbi:formimidoylglutamase [Sabulilitoribacter arenilitoris]|uniref:Formimidoylglutamase n=1 Tax=Wocania arenilitoris TaxID=2044858 RepID=A0AAE3ENW8_9FLAO|nr:formimidoylglutamase [Wocania arenilitoris]MCF7568287.1 formimidoylglutamase [Wocania arenilitoris]
MKKNSYQQTNIDYQSGQKIYWTGRKSNPDLGKQYWHQEIELIDLHHIKKENNIDIALLGYVCDEGVRRNLGRIGAAQGPKMLRESLAKLPIHFDGKRVVDAGDIICIEEDMESCQQAFANTISQLISQQIFPIAIGGGHDMAYSHFMGIRDAVKNTSKKKIGIINFDAHFDLRPVEKKSNSGTPFNQIISELEATNESVDYFAIGIQRQSNTKELFEIAKNEKVDYVVNYDCESSSEEMKVLKERLIPFIANNDYLYITIDMDGFSSAYAPGVSAPSPLGFTPYFVFKMLLFLFDTKKVISCDIAELNPTLDRDNVTANLAAKLVDFIVMHK